MPRNSIKQKSTQLHTQLARHNTQQLVPWFISLLILIASLIAIPIGNVKITHQNAILAKQIQQIASENEKLDIMLSNCDSQLESLQTSAIKKYAPELGLQKAEITQIIKISVPAMETPDRDTEHKTADYRTQQQTSTMEN